MDTASASSRRFAARSEKFLTAIKDRLRIWSRVFLCGPDGSRIPRATNLERAGNGLRPSPVAIRFHGTRRSDAKPRIHRESTMKRSAILLALVILACGPHRTDAATIIGDLNKRCALSRGERAAISNARAQAPRLAGKCDAYAGITPVAPVWRASAARSGGGR